VLSRLWILSATLVAFGFGYLLPHSTALADIQKLYYFTLENGTTLKLLISFDDGAWTLAWVKPGNKVAVICQRPKPY